MALTVRKAPPLGKITFEEFLGWADEDTHAEWEDGEVIMASLSSNIQFLGSNVVGLLKMSYVTLSRAFPIWSWKSLVPYITSGLNVAILSLLSSCSIGMAKLYYR